MNNDSNETLHIVELRIQNVKRIRAVTIRPNGDLTIIGGRNGAGKTSTLDALEMALGGAKTIPAEPVRRGARKGHVVVDLGEYVVERSFSPKGSTLVVKGKDGAPIKSPQAVLDTLCSTVAFDPAAFARMDPKKQDAVLKELLGLDFAELDGDRAQLFEARTQVNRDVKSLDARLQALPAPVAGVPAREQSVQDLLAELERRQKVEQEQDEAREGLQGLVDRAGETDDQALTVESKIADLHAALTAAQSRLDELRKVRTAQAQLIEQVRKTVTAQVDPDAAAVKRQLSEIEETNRKVRQNAERARLEEEARILAEKSVNHDDAAAGFRRVEHIITAELAYVRSQQDPRMIVRIVGNRIAISV